MPGILIGPLSFVSTRSSNKLKIHGISTVLIRGCSTDHTDLDNVPGMNGQHQRHWRQMIANTARFLNFRPVDHSVSSGVPCVIFLSRRNKPTITLRRAYLCVCLKQVFGPMSVPVCVG